jgi:hypothetical protein
MNTSSAKRTKANQTFSEGMEGQYETVTGRPYGQMVDRREKCYVRPI